MTSPDALDLLIERAKSLATELSDDEGNNVDEPAADAMVSVVAALEAALSVPRMSDDRLRPASIIDAWNNALDAVREAALRAVERG
jgi:hypothetical protein